MFHTFVFYKAYDYESFRVHYGIYEKLKLTQTKYIVNTAYFRQALNGYKLLCKDEQYDNGNIIQ
jgi:hypothetical protein